MMITLWIHVRLLIYASKRILRHYWVSLLLLFSFMPYVVIEHLTRCHNWISWLDLMNPIPWFDLISYIPWLNWISSIIWSKLIKSYLFIQFNYFDSNCYSLHIPVEGGEICYQLYSRLCDWLGPDLAWNTQGRYTLIFRQRSLC